MQHDMSKPYMLPHDKVVYKVHNSVIFLNKTPYLNGVGFGVAPRTYTKRICVQKTLKYMLKILILLWAQYLAKLVFIANIISYC